MNNGKPDILEILSEEFRDKPFPVEPDFRISISDNAYKGMIRHAMEDQKIEICGILIGEVFKDSQGPYLEISDIIKGEYADNQAGQVMFTHETWEYINSVKDGNFRNKLIVGWYHTHPNFGIFLSDQDVFIHRNFFDKPWQVAFVFDPVQEEEGFFIWRKGVPQKTSHYWLEGREISEQVSVKKIEKLIAGKINTPTQEIADEKSNINHRYLIVTLAFIVLFLISAAYFLRNDLKAFFNPLMQLNSSQNGPGPNNKSIVVSLNDLYQKINENKRLNGLPILISPTENKIFLSGFVYTLEQKEILRKLLIKEVDPDFFDIQNVMVTNVYTMQPGEGLSDIAEKIYGNPMLGKALYQYQAWGMMVFDTTKTLSYTRLLLPELK